MSERDEVHTGLRLPRFVNDRLHDEATARGLTVNRLATALLEEGLERLIPADEWKLTR